MILQILFLKAINTEYTWSVKQHIKCECIQMYTSTTCGHIKCMLALKVVPARVHLIFHLGYILHPDWEMGAPLYIYLYLFLFLPRCLLLLPHLLGLPFLLGTSLPLQPQLMLPEPSTIVNITY